MSADRIIRRAGRANLAFVGEGQAPDVREPARGGGRAEARGRQLVAVEGRAVEEVGELGSVVLVVEGQLLFPRASLDLGGEYQRPSSGCRSYSIASSAFPAMKKPSGFCCSSAR
jgi:hypothetical protein